MNFKIQFSMLVMIYSFLVISSCTKDKKNPTEPNGVDTTSVKYPQNPVPTNFADNQELSITLSWEATEVDTYIVYFGTTNNFGIYKKTTKNNLSISGLEYLTTYFWQIKFFSDDGEEIVGDIWEFQTKSKYSVGFQMSKWIIETEEPSFVNIMFQVTDMNENGIGYLQTENFEVTEDDQKVSPTESEMNIKKKDTIPYVLKTILMIDNSKSVEDNLTEIKTAALTLINTIGEKQEIAVYKFSENPVLIQDYTNDVSLLIDAVNSIQVGYQTTDLYGSIIEGSKQWTDTYSTNNVIQGFLILLTDGSDTQGSHTLSQAIEARGDRKIYTIGLGNEIEPNVLQQIGNAGFFSLSEVSELNTKFEEIQQSMLEYSNSFYWLNYLSPKRGNKDHTLKLIIKDNSNLSGSSYITGSFNSKDFTSSTINIAEPKEGDFWQVGDNVDIKWESYNVNYIKIELSLDNGSSWEEIISITESDGEYNFVVPEYSSNNCKIKITNNDDPSVYSISEGNFIINSAPEQPSNPKPYDNSTVEVTSNYVLSWGCSDPDGDMLTYDLYFGISSNPELVQQDITENSIKVAVDSNKTYYWKVIAKDNYSTISSPIWNFNTIAFTCSKTLTYGGQDYNLVQIGNQCWLKENLNIGEFIESTSYGYLQTDNGTIEKYCYDNEKENCTKYGGLYEWTEAMQYLTTEGTRGICPSGWHIPNDGEFGMLIGYVNNEAAKLVDIRESSNTTAFTPTNETGFSVLFAGYRSGDFGTFGSLGRYAGFWISNETTSYDAKDIGLVVDEINIIDWEDYPKPDGFNVRCLKDD